MGNRYGHAALFEQHLRVRPPKPVVAVSVTASFRHLRVPQPLARMIVIRKWKLCKYNLVIFEQEVIEWSSLVAMKRCETRVSTLVRRGVGARRNGTLAEGAYRSPRLARSPKQRVSMSTMYGLLAFPDDGVAG